MTIYNLPKFTGVSIDTRTLEKNNLFIAIQGHQFDGHDYLKQAKEKGAVGAIVSKLNPSLDLPQTVVDDTKQALYSIAKAHRDQFTIPVIGITGSCGKTTVRSMTQHILSQRFNVLAAEKSFNNDIGVPLTLLQLNTEHERAVIEMGANHMKEIANLTALTQPTIAVLTCAAPAHLEGFGSLDNIAQAKGEIFDGLTDNGTAIINADDRYAYYWRNLNKHRKIITFGLCNDATVMATNIVVQSHGLEFLMHYQNQAVPMTLPLLGKHNVLNALAASAAALCAGAKMEDIQQGIASLQPVPGRLVEMTGFNQCTLIDDSYNANPSSVKAAIDILSRAQESILVLGDMMEMGDAAVAMHEEIGRYAASRKIQQVFCYGNLTRHTAKEFGPGYFFEDQEELIAQLKKLVTEKSTVLVKGSNSMKMNKIVEALR